VVGAEWCRAEVVQSRDGAEQWWCTSAEVVQSRGCAELSWCRGGVERRCRRGDAGAGAGAGAGEVMQRWCRCRGELVEMW